MNILEEIIVSKKQEVSERKKHVSVAELEQSEFFRRECISLKKNLSDAEHTGIIAEFKRRSPSKGIINNTASVENVTRAYEEFGASGISVLTDTHYFGGTLKDLEKAASLSVPILRKDFMVDEYQLLEAKSYGASVILLIAACLSKNDVKRLSSTAKTLGLEVLLEIHNKEELDHICTDVDIVGVNNRDLKTFKVSIQNSLDLIQIIPRSIHAIAESGISEVETIVSLKKAGFSGFLIGEQFMKQSDPAIAFAEFIKKVRAAYES